VFVAAILPGITRVDAPEQNRRILPALTARSAVAGERQLRGNSRASNVLLTVDDRLVRVENPAEWCPEAISSSA
jgi:hypothetical protein